MSRPVVIQRHLSETFCLIPDLEPLIVQYAAESNPYESTRTKWNFSKVVHIKNIAMLAVMNRNMPTKGPLALDFWELESDGVHINDLVTALAKAPRLCSRIIAINLANQCIRSRDVFGLLGLFTCCRIMTQLHLQGNRISSSAKTTLQESVKMFGRSNQVTLFF